MLRNAAMVEERVVRATDRDRGRTWKRNHKKNESLRGELMVVEECQEQLDF